MSVLLADGYQIFDPYRILGIYTALYMSKESAVDAPHFDFLIDFSQEKTSALDSRSLTA